jgi:hypothetical protein
MKERGERRRKDSSLVGSLKEEIDAHKEKFMEREEERERDERSLDSDKARGRPVGVIIPISPPQNSFLFIYYYYYFLNKTLFYLFIIIIIF